MAVYNSWLEYRKQTLKIGLQKRDMSDLLAFREEVTDGLLRANKFRTLNNMNESISSYTLRHDR